MSSSCCDLHLVNSDLESLFSMMMMMILYNESHIQITTWADRVQESMSVGWVHHILLYIVIYGQRRNL